jgi:lathosterol oxidase
VFVVPIHVAGLLFVLTSMTIFGVINHLGYEIYPRFLVDRGVGRWFISVTHHNWHHRRFRCNYALYFRLWDIWMRTDRWPTSQPRGAQQMQPRINANASHANTMTK